MFRAVTRRAFGAAGAVTAVAFVAPLAPVQKFVDCHCQVPCGIFDDHMRVLQLREDAATIKKAMVQAAASHQEAQKGSTQALNQAVRWVMTKEKHCSDIITMVSEYMLCQRVKGENFRTKGDYMNALEKHHKVLQAAMKAKQSVDPATAEALDVAISELASIYETGH
mmetsp:Transcript_21585/g.47459  ORF Transcript_21585/g.47459 Transcript_21585/m.47459 type:complete len:167 (-) Transcript_21585:66-566(-)|eukprot:CAMPEP_0204332810 /NCGR_PEP_ID=MMETSP0469-20131031/16752_1 /ASSEMBLY_ACC=CAM_ASM_000384 /TAXON_ID=2969 /ORGANISM="Oxyrrhis marina" /LENGTH=166 /DNA_ID=CAMNT_0051316037 /DNA_START=26 /DNA_END=526 /DNA_ORIENTATION=-